MLAAQAQPTASTEKTVSDGIAIINETPAVQAVVPAIQIPQEIIQNSTAQPQTSTTQNNQAVTAQDEVLDKTPAKVETKRKGKTYAKTSSRRKAQGQPLPKQPLSAHPKNKQPNLLPALQPNQARRQLPLR